MGRLLHLHHPQFLKKLVKSIIQLDHILHLLPFHLTHHLLLLQNMVHLPLLQKNLML
ncbi:hypothetical protein O3M35_011059 [Rhynocoris fuscipes]|uniref:Uncharacterized protein n=1 Tax=Rhynocoris fuscipes TaxID=488301 RepID=A0AAW1D049_9HEMI